MEPIRLVLRMLDTLVAPARLPIFGHLVPDQATALPFLHVLVLHELLPSGWRLILWDGLLSWKPEDFLRRQNHGRAIWEDLPRQREELVHQELDGVSAVRCEVGVPGKRRDVEGRHVSQIILEVVLSRRSRRQNWFSIFSIFGGLSLGSLGVHNWASCCFDTWASCCCGSWACSCFGTRASSWRGSPWASWRSSPWASWSSSPWASCC
mmetsp:Transcript_47142/g.85021  ORF Transcript_47142/g.85021 Transcript_47142/m.85021 type:complete len:208 (+) Transcript_47142:632-1255(+)